MVLGVVGGNFFFFQAEDGIRDLVRSRGLGDVYKRQEQIGEGVIENAQVMLPEYVALETDVAKKAEGRLLSLIHI